MRRGGDDSQERDPCFTNALTEDGEGEDRCLAGAGQCHPFVLGLIAQAWEHRPATRPDPGRTTRRRAANLVKPVGSGQHLRGSHRTTGAAARRPLCYNLVRGHEAL